MSTLNPHLKSKGTIGIETDALSYEEWMGREASDPEGAGYYDLVSIMLDDDAYLCIPLPLLSDKAIEYMRGLPPKEVRCLDRHAHNGRRYYDLEPKEICITEKILRLWMEEYIPEETIKAAREWGLRDMPDEY